MIHLMEKCVTSDDSQYVSYAAEVICNVARDNRDYRYCQYLLEQGIMSIVEQLLVRWSTDDAITSRLLGILLNMTQYNDPSVISSLVDTGRVIHLMEKVCYL